MALASAGLNSNAIQVQELSIKAYEESDANLASDELKALSSDELGHLAALHLKCKNRPAAMQAAQRIETILRQRLDDTATDKTRWRRALADVLLYQARILYNDNQTKDSAEKYKESIAINQALLDQKQGNAASENQLSSARKELAQLTNNSVDPQPTAIISP